MMLFFRNMIQVRCSLDDVAENFITSALSRGEKTTMIPRQLSDILFCSQQVFSH